MRYWALWQVAVPVIILGSFWPVNWMIKGSQHPFQDAFCHGELLLFASLLLMGVAIDTKLEERRLRMQGSPVDLGFVREVVRAFAFLAILSYGAVRYHFVFAEASNTTVDLSIMTGYACASCSVAVLAVGHGAYVLAKTERIKQEMAEGASET